MATKSEVTRSMTQLFRGRGESYALKIMKANGKKFFIPHRDSNGQDLKLTEQVISDHLDGKISIGVYPLDTDNSVYWAAVDFDGKLHGDPVQDALKVKTEFNNKLGLISWLEKSQSGKGIHLWVFFKEKIQAKVVRRVLGSCIPEFNASREKTTSYDRMFPAQDSSAGGYGNLCAIPLNGEALVSQGRTSFVDDKGEPYSNQSDIIIKAYEQRNNLAVLHEAFKKMPAIKTFDSNKVPTIKQIPGGTKLLCPQGCAWLRSCMSRSKTLPYPEWYAALTQFGKVEEGELLAHRFSEDHPDYDYNDTQKQFEHAVKANKPLLCTTVWEKFGDCGKRCDHLGVYSPWQIAKVPLARLDEGNKGKVYSGQEIGDLSIKLATDIAEGKRLGFTWGYDVLDDATELRPGNLIIVAARRSIGKTAWMVDVAAINARKGIPQLIFSIEMSVVEIGMRLLANLSAVDHTLITTGKLDENQWTKVLRAKDELDKLPIYIDDSTRDLDRMLDNAGEFVYKHGKGPVWVDYLQLIKKDARESKKEAVDKALDAYKQMSKILEVPIVNLAQMNRLEESSESEIELDQWLKDSGDIEQTADVIIYLRGERGPGTISRKVILHKDRHREAGISFKFNLHQNVFKFKPDGKWSPQAEEDDHLLFSLAEVPDELDL